MKPITAIVQEYIEKYSLDGKLTVPKQTLAKMILQGNPTVDFTGETIEKKIDNLRAVIRGWTGSIGDKRRADNPHIIPQLSNPKEGLNLLQEFIDESDCVESQPFQIQGAKNIVIINDVHIPFFHQKSIITVFKYLKDTQPDVLYLNGDIMDCYRQSSFQPDPRRRNTKGELKLTKEFLSILRSKLPNSRIIYKFGNHEKRWEDYLKNKAPELLEIDEFHLNMLLGLNGMGIDYLPQDKYAVAGYLNILHGHELGKTFGIPANPARWLYTKLKGNAAIGHLHVTSSHSESSINKSEHATFTIGCLCGLNPEYFPTAFVKWNHGFAHVEMDGDNFTFNNHKIINGEIRR
jgi:hypothetical protein